jgi:very-short-patch-repair endonuclease
MTTEATLHRLASAQHALVTTRQLRELGLTFEAIGRKVEHRQLERVHRGVYRIPGSVHTFEQTVLAACWAHGGTSAASHRCAAQLWDLDLWGCIDVVELTTTSTRSHRLPGVAVHRSVDLSDEQIVSRHGVPVTSPLRLLVDLGAVVPPGSVSDALDDLVGRKVVTIAGARTTLERLSARGRSGCGILREILDQRTGRERTMARTRLEALLSDLCHRAGIELEFQHPILLGGRRRRIDFAVPSLRIAIEVDGYESHSRYDVFQDDRVRANELELEGWTVLRFTWEQLTKRPTYVLDVLRRAISRAA